MVEIEDRQLPRVPVERAREEPPVARDGVARDAPRRRAGHHRRPRRRVGVDGLEPALVDHPVVDRAVEAPLRQAHADGRARGDLAGGARQRIHRDRRRHAGIALGNRPPRQRVHGPVEMKAGAGVQHVRGDARVRLGQRNPVEVPGRAVLPLEVERRDVVGHERPVERVEQVRARAARIRRGGGELRGRVDGRARHGHVALRIPTVTVAVAWSRFPRSRAPWR